MNETIVLGSQSQHQPSASNKRKRKTSKKSKNNVESNNVIDVDDYDYDDVIVIDFPALFPKRVRKSGTIVCVDEDRSIICVDDDNDGIDVEFEESSGKLKEQWEKAFSKRQNEVCVASYSCYLSLSLSAKMVTGCSLFSSYLCLPIWQPYNLKCTVHSLL